MPTYSKTEAVQRACMDFSGLSNVGECRRMERLSNRDMAKYTKSFYQGYNHKVFSEG